MRAAAVAVRLHEHATTGEEIGYCGDGLTVAFGAGTDGHDQIAEVHGLAMEFAVLLFHLIQMLAVNWTGVRVSRSKSKSYANQQFVRVYRAKVSVSEFKWGNDSQENAVAKGYTSFDTLTLNDVSPRTLSRTARTSTATRDTSTVACTSDRWGNAARKCRRRILRTGTVDIIVGGICFTAGQAKAN